jgi:hypothetical protein
MRTRHRIPTIFSLSLLDMLCCALGAMILLMLVNMWDARRQATVSRAKSRELEETLTALTGTQSDRDTLRQKEEEARSELARMQARLKSREQDADALAQRSKLAERDAADLRTQLAQALLNIKEREKQLAATEAERMTALANLKTAAAELEKEKRLLAAALTKLNLTEKERADAEKLALLVPTLRAGLADAEKRISATDAELSALKKRADEAGLRLTEAQKHEQTVLVEVNTLKKLLDEQKTLSGRLRSRLTDAENRFAGVDLGGKRVVLLVDMSGSMGSVDGQNIDPTKWPEVRRTVVQVLKSLGEVERFQVILFSTSTQYLLGKPGEWLEYNRVKSPDDVERALAAVAPKGDTNLYAAMEAAFQYKSQGLDAIYVFSDGLPNNGPGLPANPPTEESAREALLGKYLRDAIKTRWNTGSPRVRIHSVGFFYESPNLGAFLWALSRENGGSFVGMSRP